MKVFPRYLNILIYKSEAAGAGEKCYSYGLAYVQELPTF